MKPYLVVVVLNPTKKQVEEDEGVPQMVVQPVGVLAKNTEHAKMKAARMVPEEHADKDDRLEIFVLPFA